MERKGRIIILGSAVVLVVVLAAVLFFLLPTPRAASWDEPKEMRQRRLDMVSRQIAARGVRDKAVLEAMSSVPRHLFVPQSLQERAYVDSPLPIDAGQTISQPWTVVFMTEMLDVRKGQKVLEIGAGSGWQAALLGCMIGPKGKVFAIEINEWLAGLARENLGKTNLKNVEILQ